MKNNPTTLFPIYLWKKDILDLNFLEAKYPDGSWVALSYNILKPDIFIADTATEALGKLILNLSNKNDGRFPSLEVIHTRP